MVRIHKFFVYRFMTPALGLVFALAGVLFFAAVSLVQGQTNGVVEAHDTALPIEITAERLEVQTNQRIAIFEGQVVARQGNLRLEADIIKVFYRTADGDDGSDAARTNAISRIDTTGNVRVFSGTETARGDWGTYDVDRKLIILGGDVRLERGASVLVGNRLEIDLTNNRSRIDADPGSTGEGRVRGIFTPDSGTSDSP